MSPSAAPPSPQEIQRKLSVHSVSKGAKRSNFPKSGPVSGTESDSDSNDLSPAVPLASSVGSVLQAPLSAIAERRDVSGEDTEDEEEGGWKTASMKDNPANSIGEGVIKSGYLWKKGERRKTWKKRWFVLRPHHLAYYKNSAEYQLHRLLDLSEVHSCTPVTLKRHEHTFSLISPTRTFYLRASNNIEVQEWVKAIEDARRALMATSTQSSNNGHDSASVKQAEPDVSQAAPSPSSQFSPIAAASSSDTDDAAPNIQQIVSPSPQRLTFATPSKPQQPAPSSPGKDTKVIISGYLLKCGSKRKTWRKRWFVLTGEKLLYSGSHMDTKSHRQFPFSNILDALEFNVPAGRQNIGSPSSPPSQSASGDQDDSHHAHTFKIVTTKRTLLLCAPTEEDEIRWLGAVRALIARRSESGQVPGYAPKESGKPQSPEHTGLKGKMRRLSTTGDNPQERSS
ncbi:pleckstrin-like protein [Amanita muscaria]